MTTALKAFNLFVIISLLICCTTAQFYNTRCTHNDQCDTPNQFLQCFHGYCQCDSRTQIFDHGLKQCVIRPGGNCYFQGGTNNYNGFPKCSRNSVCVSSICQCQPGHAIPPTGEVLCKPNINNFSNNNCGDCDAAKGLECFDGACLCKNRSLSYQGMFGCVDARNPEFVEMMDTLKHTENLLKENHIDIDTLIKELDVGEGTGVDENQGDNRLKPRQLFSDSNPFGTIDSSVDLFTAPQNIFNAFTSLGSLLRPFQQAGNALRSSYGPPGAGNGGGGNQNQNQGGYPASGQTGQGQSGTGGTGGYPDSGQTGAGGYSNTPQAPQFALITNLLNLFNQIVPFLRRLSTLLNPFRFVQKLLTNLRFLFPGTPTTGTGLRGSSGTGGYSGGNGNPSSSYGPPSPGQGSSGNNGGGTPAVSYGPPAAQSTQNYNNQIVAPTQSNQNQQQPQAQATFATFQASVAPTSNFETPTQFRSSIPTFLQNANRQNQTQQNTYRNHNGGGGSNNGPPIIVLPTQNQNQFAQTTKFPRQERERVSSNSNNFGDSSSPYLPEHL